jgi:hypothetical protein
MHRVGSAGSPHQMSGFLNALDPVNKTGLIRDEENNLRDFRLNDLVRAMEFEYFSVGDLVAFNPTTRLGRRIAINVQRVTRKCVRDIRNELQEIRR